MYLPSKKPCPLTLKTGRFWSEKPGRLRAIRRKAPFSCTGARGRSGRSRLPSRRFWRPVPRARLPRPCSPRARPLPGCHGGAGPRSATSTLLGPPAARPFRQTSTGTAAPADITRAEAAPRRRPAGKPPPAAHRPRSGPCPCPDRPLLPAPAVVTAVSTGTRTSAARCFGPTGGVEYRKGPGPEPGAVGGQGWRPGGGKPAGTQRRGRRPGGGDSRQLSSPPATITRSP
jgi:hypothetical protein